ncbi:hypothetical protein CHARACLAT_026717 [Characodon lateralis]|uniref:Uncharacterized protein n=1 Tax=Characodon lateralis TaxID=208331 RepID=A0ABU7DUG1_9TELE|nr:hypothetical protein [Characodon lateralis]
MEKGLMDLADSRQESARDRWVQCQMEEAMKHFLSDLEVLPSPRLLEEMELAPAGPGSDRGAVVLFTFLSREAEKTLHRSAGLSVPQLAFGCSKYSRIFVCNSTISQACCNSAHAVFARSSPVL